MLLVVVVVRFVCVFLLLLLLLLYVVRFLVRFFLSKWESGRDRECGCYRCFYFCFRFLFLLLLRCRADEGFVLQKRETQSDTEKTDRKEGKPKP